MNQLQIYMPPPSNWQDFQILVAEVARVKYISSSVQEYGRQGQRQNGIDVYAVDHLEKKIGIQCKETKKDEFSSVAIDKEVNKAETFSPRLDLFIIATTLRTDAAIQKHVNELNANKTVQFLIQVWFWDDLNREINKSQSVMCSYYKAYRDNFGVEEIRSHLSALRQAFSRPAFEDNFMHERNYREFEDALVDTKAFFRIGFLYDRITRNLISQVIPSHMIGDEAYAKFVQGIEKDLNKIYQDFLQDKKIAQNKNPLQMEEKAGEYNILRRKIMNKINDRLYSEKLPAININY